MGTRGVEVVKLVVMTRSIRFEQDTEDFVCSTRRPWNTMDRHTNTVTHTDSREMSCIYKDWEASICLLYDDLYDDLDTQCFA